MTEMGKKGQDFVKQRWCVDDQEFDETVSALQGMVLEGYSEKFKREFLNPENIGKIENPDAYKKTTGVCGDTVWMWLCVKKRRIEDIKFMTDGCGFTIVCNSYITRIVKGKLLEDALQIKAEDVDKYFKGLPEENKHCAKLAVDALEAVIKEYIASRW